MALKWSEMPLLWQKKKLPLLFSSTKSTQSAQKDSITINLETEKYKELCFNCLTIWTVFHQTTILKWSVQLTDLTFWIPPWWDQDDWIEKYSFHFLTKMPEYKSSKSIQEKWITKKLTLLSSLDQLRTSMALCLKQSVWKQEWTHWEEEVIAWSMKIMSRA